MTDYEKKMSGEYIESVGRRKTATARVRMYAGDKVEVIVNGQTLEEYFPTEEMRLQITDPFSTVEDITDPFFVSVHVSGSGLSGQAGAIRHGISRALVEHANEAKKPLKDKGYLKRDPRMVERKKPGKKKARKSSQWSKR
ncbi:MAG: 30S ribosomal protein S9 [Candidatus Paceibacterota bacterium]